MYLLNVSFASLIVFCIITDIFFSSFFLTLALAHESLNCNLLTVCRSVRVPSPASATHRYSVRVLVAYFGWFHTSVLWGEKETTNRRSEVTGMPEATWRHLLKSSLPSSRYTKGREVQALKYGASFFQYSFFSQNKSTISKISTNYVTSTLDAIWSRNPVCHVRWRIN